MKNVKKIDRKERQAFAQILSNAASGLGQCDLEDKNVNVHRPRAGGRLFS